MLSKSRMVLAAVLLSLTLWAGDGWGKPYTFEFAVPRDHDMFTVVIEDEAGRRVRNLLGMAPVGEYTSDGRFRQGNPIVRVDWDGLDDKGQRVPAGRYTARGLSLPALKATFDFAWYGPGDPAWLGYPTSGWGGDHVGPSSIVAIPDGVDTDWCVVVAGAQCEGGDGIFALNEQGRKVFGYRRAGAGATALGVYKHYVYATLWEKNALIRLDSRTGRLAPFQRPAGVAMEISLKNEAFDLAVGIDMIALVIRPGGNAGDRHLLEFRDIDSGMIIESQTIDKPGKLLADADGMFYIVDEDGIRMVGLGGLSVPVVLPDVEKPGASSFDYSGNLMIVDRGDDFQLKILDRNFQLIDRIGTRGGQGTRLRFDRHAHQETVADVTRDRLGRVWTTEHGHPRRQVLWREDGRAARHFVGNTQYGASGTALHDQDPRIAMAYGAIYGIDNRVEQRYEPLGYMSSGRKEGSPFELFRYASGFLRPQLFRSDISGEMREYCMMPNEKNGYILYQRKRGGDYRPIAALLPHWQWPGDPATGGIANPNPGGIHIWSDLNSDEKLQREELQLVPESETVGHAWVRPFGGWTFPMHQDLGFYLNGKIIRPVSFTAEGVPVYDVAGSPEFEDADEITTVFSEFHRVGDHLYGTHFYPQPFHGQHVFTDLNGKIIGTFEFDAHALHGSMQKGVPPPGKTSGEQFISGIADMGGDIGSVLAFQGNYGQAFLFSEDGLYISTLFRDARTPNDGWGEKMEKGLDWTNVTMQQEPFGGWFGRQDDGVVRYQFGRNACVVARVHGLESIERFRAERAVEVR